MEMVGVVVFLKSGGDFFFCSYCEDGFMYCFISGVLGSLLSDAVFSSFLFYRSEYCFSEGFFIFYLDRVLWGRGESWLFCLMCVCIGYVLGLYSFRVR